MEKKDLKTGMICKLREGSESLRIVFLPHGLIAFDDQEEFKYIEDDLTNSYNGSEYDIMKVYDSEMNLLWEREETHVISVDGKDIELSHDSYLEFKKQFKD